MIRRSVPILLALLAACGNAPAVPAARLEQDPAKAESSKFPLPDRPVADIVTATWSDEDSRDNAGEAETVFRLLGVKPGMTVADIGAGSGYYTVRLSPVVGSEGRVLANDIMPDYLLRLRARTTLKGLSNIDFILGGPDDARLPPASTDVALMVHMYHEIEQPFGLLWRLHASLKPEGRIAIIDADKPTNRHGTPPDLLRCELEAVGFREIARHKLPGLSYMAVFAPVAPPPPSSIRACNI